MIAGAQRTGEPFSCQHRIIRVDDQVERVVVVVGEVTRDLDFIDVTDAGGGRSEPSADVRNAELLAELARTRAELSCARSALGQAWTEIEQADAGAAILRWPLGPVTLAITGEIDLSNRLLFAEQPTRLEDAAVTGRDIHIDARGLDFIDIHSIMRLIDLARRLPPGQRLILDTSRMLRRVLTLWPEHTHNIAGISGMAEQP